MEKKFDIKLEVVHFQTEDVIVTSGPILDQQGKSISYSTWYATIGSELGEVGLERAEDNSLISGNTRYLFNLGEFGGYRVITKWKDQEVINYAWHSGDSWYYGSNLIADKNDTSYPALSKFTNFYSN